MLTADNYRFDTARSSRKHIPSSTELDRERSMNTGPIWIPARSAKLKGRGKTRPSERRQEAVWIQLSWSERTAIPYLYR